MDPQATPVETARTMLPPLARRFFARGRKAARPTASAADLHRFRLAAKRFRYTLELFRPLYGPALERRLSSLRRVQQILGEANDCATARELLPAGRVAAFVERRAAQLGVQFRDFWTTTFDAPGEERGWLDYLTRFAGRNHRL